MGYLLNGSTIRSPSTFDESNSTQVAQNRTLAGNITRDYFGSNKRVWTLNYENVNITDYTTINNLYQTYLSTGTTQTWQITETNYTVSSTKVHLDLLQRSFGIKGSDYLSNFTLILTEA